MSSHELRGESRTAPQWQGALPARALQGLYCVLVWWPQRHPQPVQNGRLALKGLLELKKKGRRVGAECEQDLGIGRNPRAKVRAGWGKSVPTTLCGQSAAKGGGVSGKWGCGPTRDGFNSLNTSAKWVLWSPHLTPEKGEAQGLRNCCYGLSRCNFRF